MKILFYNPTTSQKRFIPFEAIKGSAFFRRPNYDAMRLSYKIKDDEFFYYDERIEEKPSFQPELVIINVPLNLARYIKTTVRKKWPRAKIICCGFYPTLFPENCKKFSDVVVVGDIVNIWDDILQAAKNNCLRKQYFSNDNPQFKVDRSIELKYGFTPILSQLRISFGCTCHNREKDFCYENIMYKKYIEREINDAVHDVAQIKRKIIFMRDDDFLHNQDFSIRFLDRCWRYKKNWIFQTSAKSLFQKPLILPMLRDHGVRMIHLKEDWLGIDLINKIKNKAFITEKKHEISMVHRNRIACGCKIRLGYPGESFEFYQELFRFLKHLKIDFIKIATQMPIPKTPTYKKYKKQGIIIEDLSLYDQWMPVVKLPQITPQTLYSWMEWLRDSFYSWDSILMRNILVSPHLGFYNTIFFYLIPNLSYRNNFLEKVGYPP